MGSEPSPGGSETFLLPAPAAAKFGVTVQTLRNWARAGKISAIRTLGGHRRYREAEVSRLLAGEATA
jgi:excisionase family DNA binding protein